MLAVVFGALCTTSPQGKDVALLRLRLYFVALKSKQTKIRDLGRDDALRFCRVQLLVFSH